MSTCRVCGHPVTSGRCGVCGTTAPVGVVGPTPPTGAAAAAPHPGATPPVLGTAGPMSSATLRPGMESIQGTLLKIDGPRSMDPPRDPWRWAAFLMLLVMLLPLVAIFWMFRLVSRLAFSVMFPRSGGGGSGGRSLVDELLLHHWLDKLLRRPEKISSYQLVVRTSAGRRLARQEGEFLSGSPLVGNDVRLDGRLREGVLVVESGEDLTMGVHFRRPVSPYRTVFFVSLAVFLLGLVLLGGMQT